MSPVAEAIITILKEQGKPLHIVSITHFLENMGAVVPWNIKWEIGSREERLWWEKIHNAADETIRSGQVGTYKDNFFFLALRVVEKGSSHVKL